MRTLTLLLIVTAVLSQQCNKGGLLSCQNACFYPNYLEGCLNYASEKECQEC